MYAPPTFILDTTIFILHAEYIYIYAIKTGISGIEYFRQNKCNMCRTTDMLDESVSPSRVGWALFAFGAAHQVRGSGPPDAEIVLVGVQLAVNHQRHRVCQHPHHAVVVDLPDKSLIGSVSLNGHTERHISHARAYPPDRSSCRCCAAAARDCRSPPAVS